MKRSCFAPRAADPPGARAGEHRQAHGARGGRQVCGARAIHGRPRLVGHLQSSFHRRKLRLAADAPARLLAGPRRLCAGLLCRGRSRVLHAHPHHHPEGLAQPLCAHHVPEDPQSGQAEEARAGIHRARRAGLPGFAHGGRHPHRHVHHPQFPRAPGHYRRLELRRRNQEDHLHRAQLPAAAGRRAVHALLGQRRQRRRRGHLLRPLRHRQDHAFRRPQPPPDWRRRARLERQRRFQFRGRLLRQGHPAFRGSRAANLRGHPPLWDDSGKRGVTIPSRATSI